MQFGKISGLSLIILGILLCGLQLMQWMAPKTPPKPPDQSVAQPAPKTTSVLPGIIGAGSLILGVILVSTARRKDEPDPQHAVK